MNVIVSQNAPKAIGPYSQAMVSNGMPVSYTHLTLPTSGSV